MKICPACSREYSDEAVQCTDDGVALVHLDTSGGNRGAELVGQVVDGRYRIERVVGRGGMGTVYACRHVVVGKSFAMKVLRSGIERSEEILQRFIREAQAANAIKSRHICEMSDFGQLPNGAFYVVMELLEGISLTRALREKRLGKVPLLRVLTQIASTLHRAHKAGIVHRDLKPDNVVLVREENDPFFVKLVDFGIAKMMQSKAADLTETGIILGTPYYMSPEQARGENIDHRSDIYALGVIMYRAFTGQLPFIADTQMGVLTRHLTQKPELPSLVSDVDPISERLIMRCLAKRPIDRFQSMEDVVAALQSIPEEYSDVTAATATMDERALARRAAESAPPNSLAAAQVPRPNPRPEPTLTKIETPQAQVRAALGQPMPFPNEPSSGPTPVHRPDPNNAPICPPPLPGEPRPASVSSSPHSQHGDHISPTPHPGSSHPLPGASGPYPQQGPLDSVTPHPGSSHPLPGASGPYPQQGPLGATPPPGASHPPPEASGPYPQQAPAADPLFTASPGGAHQAFPAASPAASQSADGWPDPHGAPMQVESFTNRGVVSSRLRTHDRRRHAQRVAIGVGAATLILLAGIGAGVFVVSKPNSNAADGPTPQASPPPTPVSTSDTSASTNPDNAVAPSAAPATSPSPATSASASSSADAAPSASLGKKPRRLPPKRIRAVPPSQPSPPPVIPAPPPEIRSPFD